MLVGRNLEGPAVGILRGGDGHNALQAARLIDHCGAAGGVGRADVALQQRWQPAAGQRLVAAAEDAAGDDRLVDARGSGRVQWRTGGAGGFGQFQAGQAAVVDFQQAEPRVEVDPSQPGVELLAVGQRDTELAVAQQFVEGHDQPIAQRDAGEDLDVGSGVLLRLVRRQRGPLGHHPHSDRGIDQPLCDLLGGQRCIGSRGRGSGGFGRRRVSRRLGCRAGLLRAGQRRPQEAQPKRQVPGAITGKHGARPAT